MLGIMNPKISIHPGSFSQSFCAAVCLAAGAALSFPPPHVCAAENPAAPERLAGDGVTLNTLAFNAAIEKLSDAGGGTLSIPPGRYLTGTVYLRSGVTLHLENGAVLLGSTNISDYPENQPPLPAAALEFGRYSLIYAAGQHDVAITGEGKICGQGSSPSFTKKSLLARGWSANEAYLKRPYGLCFVGCRRVQVRNVTLENLAFWTEDYLDCDDVVVDGVTVNNLKDDYNNDGIDVDGSRNVRIANCYFMAGDDGICLKSSYTPCENITINNCVIRALCNGVKMGTASRGGFKNISVANCAIDQTGLAGLALEVVDGGVLDGVTAANLTMSDVGTPVFIRLGNRGKKWTDAQPPAVPGTLRNVVVSGITATLARKDGTLASSISGLPGYPIENVTLDNIRISVKKGFGNVHLDAYQLGLQHTAKSLVDQRFDGDIRKLAPRQVPEKPLDYPEYSMFGPLPAYGFFCRHVKNLVFENIDLQFDKDERRSALAFEDVRGLNIDGLRARSSAESNPVLLFHDVQNAFVTRGVAEKGTPVFLRAEGDSDHISLLDSDLAQAASPLSVDPSLQGRAITLDAAPAVPASKAADRP
jgi:Glycosyl hydrolases family 28